MKFATKKELKSKFDLIYKDKKSPWRFDITDHLYVSKKEMLTPYIEESKSILDLGCGEGNFLESMIGLSQNKSLVGVDIAENAILLAQEKDFYNELYSTYIDDIDTYSQTIQKYDLILLNEVLYYVDNYIDVLNNIFNVANRYVFISVAMGNTFFDTKDTAKIENLFREVNFILKEKRVVNLSFKFNIPIRYLKFLYKALGRPLKQTHKYIYVYEKIG